MIKKIFLFVIDFILIFVVSSCVIDIDDDDWDNNSRADLYGGYWYPNSSYGLTTCEYNSYFRFSGSNYEFYDCDNYLDDSGIFYLDGRYLIIDYSDGTENKYYIDYIDKTTLSLQDISTGKNYSYIKKY